VEIVVRSAASFSIAAPSPICTLDSVQLLASGGDIYLWSPITDLSDPNIPNPWASPIGTTDYSVQITDTVCNNTETLSTVLNVWPLPAVNAQSANDIGCTIGESQLTASGAVTYSWSPAASLNDSNISDPIATPVTTTQYYVTGTDMNGCSNKDSVVVNVDMTNLAKFLMPSAFTPNGDGLNDCFGMKYWGQILEVEFNIYNRWGQKVFHSRTPGQCWDGTFMGTKQPPGTFVYWIRAKTNCANDVFRKGHVTLIR
jgi:gliding motility-associated-like protein